MAIVAPDGRWLQVNAALCRITGYSESELLSTTRQDLTHPDDVAENLRLATALLAGRIEVFGMEKRYVHRQGHIVWVHLNVTLVRTDEGSPSYFVAQIQDISERRRTLERMEYLVDHDPLTGLFNRRGFQRELERHSRQVREFGAEGAVLVIDLDRFKYVNDSLGHHAGDAIIAAAGRTIADSLAPTDIVARLGGDEFAVILPRATEKAACDTASRLVEHIVDGLAPMDTAGLRVTASIGIASFVDPDESADGVLVNADLAMYDAKEAGGDRAVWSSTGERANGPSMKTRVSWIEHITAALREDRFELHAQPIQHIARGEVGHYELLIRLRTDDGDLIPPASFLDVAERFDLITDIDAWVIAQAAELVRRLEDAGKDVTLAVNLSARSVCDTGLVERVRDEVRRAGASPRRLIFEITETAAATDLIAARRTAAGLGEIGCKVALDDFGAGFGTFSYLKNLPFDIIKIDGQFVQGCAENAADRVIIETIVRLASGLGKSTVAEFTSDGQIMQALRTLGVDYAQGYFVGRPEPVDALLAEPGACARPAPSAG